MINFSELLWKSSRTKAEGLRNGSTAVSGEVEVASGLEHVAVENAGFTPDSRIARLTDPLGVGADRFRFMRMRLCELKELAKLQTLAITSPLPADGKSTIAMSLTTALGEGGARSALLIEADMHHPTLADDLGIPRRRGLADCLQDGLDPMSLVQKVEPLGWHLLQAGEPRRNPADLLQSEAFSAVIRGVSQYFDWIVMDTPPVLPLTDALVLSRQSDATLLVVRADSTPREAIEEAVSLIGKKQLLGIVLNGAEDLGELYSQYRNRYGHK